MNGTALLAMGILLEEAMAERLGENGDMVFAEPEINDQGMYETLAVKTEIQGSVPVVDSPPYLSDDASDSSDHGQYKRSRAEPR